jgi:hypothetical protein
MGKKYASRRIDANRTSRQADDERSPPPTPPRHLDPGTIMKATVVRALTITGAIAVAFAIGHSPHPATATLAAAPICTTQQTQPTPTDSIPLARGDLVPV